MQVGQSRFEEETVEREITELESRKENEVIAGGESEREIIEYFCFPAGFWVHWVCFFRAHVRTIPDLNSFLLFFCNYYFNKIDEFLFLFRC